MHNEPPGRLGFPFVGETLQFGANVTDFARTRHELYGPVWKTRIAGWKSVFVTGMPEVWALGHDEAVSGALLVSEGILNMVEPIYGRGFYLHDGEESVSIRELLAVGLNEDAVRDIFFPILLAQWPDRGEVTSFCAYEDSKEWINQCLIEGMVGAHPESREDIARLGTELFRAVTSSAILGLGSDSVQETRQQLLVILDMLVTLELENQSMGAPPSQTMLARIVHTARERKPEEFPKERICLDLLWLTSPFLVKSLASACSTTLMLILHDEKAGLQCREEQFKACHPMTFESLKQFTYLDNCAVEALRLWPPSLVVSRGLTQDVVLPNGMTVTRDYKIWFHLHQLNRDPRILDAPHEFRPERWESSKPPPGRCPMTFGISTQRSCQGELLTMTFVTAYVAMLIREYPHIGLDAEFIFDMKYLPVSKRVHAFFSLANINTGRTKPRRSPGQGLS